MFFELFGSLDMSDEVREFSRAAWKCWTDIFAILINFLHLTAFNFTQRKYKNNYPFKSPVTKYNEKAITGHRQTETRGILGKAASWKSLGSNVVRSSVASLKACLRQN